MNVASMVEEVARAVSATVSRSIAPLQRQLDELLAWRKSVGELRNGADGAKGEKGDSGKDGARGADGKDAPPVDMESVVAKVLALVPTPKDGARGSDGRDGRDGTDGAKGEPGIDGKDGRDGLDGKDGAPGQNGKDGANGLDGARGEKGADGLNGKDGSNGKDGKDGLHGKDGANGIDGKDGAPGPRGEKGDVASEEDIAAAVTKAVDAMLPSIVSKHVELAMPEIIARASVLVPPGRDGLPGRPGTPGEDGKPGVSIEGFEFKQVDRRTQVCVMKMTDGGRYEWPIRMDGMVLDADVHRPGEAYEKGDAVTHGGSYWIAKRDTKAAPGKSDDWRLAVKRGRDGKDAVEDAE